MATSYNRCDTGSQMKLKIGVEQVVWVNYDSFRFWTNYHFNGLPQSKCSLL